MSGDVGMLQTAAALENLAVSMYSRLAALPAERSGGSIPVVRSLMAAALQHHRQHADALNAAAKALGGAAQSGVDSAVDGSVVSPGLARVAGAADAVLLAASVEEIVGASHVGYGSTAGDPRAVRAFATVAPVEAQHAAALRAIGALLAAGLPELVVQGPDASKLPASSLSAGVPASFVRTSLARPAGEGAR